MSTFFLTDNHIWFVDDSALLMVDRNRGGDKMPVMLLGGFRTPEPGHYDTVMELFSVIPTHLLQSQIAGPGEVAFWQSEWRGRGRNGVRHY